MRANASLARANAGMRQRERLAFRQARVFEAISEFLDSITSGSALIDVVTQIARSVAHALNTQTDAALFQVPEGGEWRLVRFGPTGRPFGRQVVEPSADAMPLDSIVREFPGPAPAAVLLPWLAEPLGDEVELDEMRVISISGSSGSGVMLLVRAPLEEVDDSPMFLSLSGCWQAALSAAIHRDRFAHLTEQLAEANRSMLDMQERLARNQTMATLGEVAAGAAHEMNNPLTIISGRSQLLARRVEDAQLRRMAVEIMEQAHRLSGMITALRSFAEPVSPGRQEVDLADLVVRTVQRHGPREGRQPQVNTIFPKPLPPVFVDPGLISGALGELVQNAVESKGCTHIELRVQTESLNDRLKIEVRDDGSGLSEHVLKHAFDPFFSAKPAGRQPGLGLANARRFVEAHGGRITLANSPGGGAVATIWLDEWRRPSSSSEAA
jgi:signal transduction histidine kinase